MVDKYSQVFPLPSLKLTASSHLKIDSLGRRSDRLPFGVSAQPARCELAVSFREYIAWQVSQPSIKLNEADIIRL